MAIEGAQRGMLARAAQSGHGLLLLALCSLQGARATAGSRPRHGAGGRLGRVWEPGLIASQLGLGNAGRLGRASG
jgi:hypothetical protein